jgi:hypothetical protein
MTEQTKKEEEKEPQRKLKPEDYEVYHDSTGVMRFLPPKRCRTCEDWPSDPQMSNNVILECPRCLTLFAISTVKAKQISEKLWGTRCKCGNIIEFDLDYMDPVQLWAQPQIANRIKEIENYRIGVEGLTYAKGTWIGRLLEMEAKDSRPVSELSQSELIEYFGQKSPQPVYPDWKLCVLHGIRFIFKCPGCSNVGTNATA